MSDIACGGMALPVREAFANVMYAVVELASRQPAKCINTIAMLCIVPYTQYGEHTCTCTCIHVYAHCAHIHILASVVLCHLVSPYVS